MFTAGGFSNQVELNKVPNTPLLLLKAALKRSHHRHQKWDENALPRKMFCVDNIKLCGQNIAKYHKVVLWQHDSGLIHPCYLHTLAFPLQMKLLLLPDFPFATLGLVHIRNQLMQLKPIKIADVFNMRSQFIGLEQHPKGWMFDIRTEYFCHGEMVWQGVSRYLARTQKNTPGPDEKVLDEQAPVMQAKSVYQVDTHLGRRYASVSGDFNPIHLTRLTAKIFGFKRHIAHGMWTKAYSLSMLAAQPDVDLVHGFKLDVSFKQPLFLPNQIHLFSQKSNATQWRHEENFSVRSFLHEHAKVHVLGKFLSI